MTRQQIRILVVVAGLGLAAVVLLGALANRYARMLGGPEAEVSSPRPAP